MRGYFGIGIYQTKTEVNVGTLYRSAYLMGASFIFTIGKRYKRQASDTPNAMKHIPLFEYLDFNEFKNNTPKDCKIICIELDNKAIDLTEFKHPERCIYLLGAEDNGIPEAIYKNYDTIKIPTLKPQSMNVSVAGSIVMYDRYLKGVIK